MKISFLLKITFAICFLCFTQLANAQVFWSENFTNNGLGWTLNVATGTQDPDANIFYISDDEGGGITPNLGAPSSCGIATNGNNTLHVTASATITGGGSMGAAYLSGGLCSIGICATTNTQSESMTINCSGKSNISLGFNYIENGDGLNDNASLWYFNGTNWTLLDDMPKTLTGCSGQGLWTSRIVALPASANNNANVKIAFRWVNNDDGVGTDPSFAVDDITMSTPATSNTLSTIINQSFNYKCACDSIGVYFQSTGTFNTGNIYQVQLSNSAGSFASPVIIGSLTSTANTGFINCPIPCTTVTGTAYRIRVVSTNPAVTGTDNGFNIIIYSSANPTILIAQTPQNPVCVGTTVNFVATVQNAGTSPTYQWKKNGNNVGTNSSMFSTNTLVNGDIISCSVTSTAPCITVSTATSNLLTVNVITPSVSVVTTPPNTTICAGTQIALCASGASTYVWSGNISNCTPFTPSGSGAYTVTATDANNCVTSSIVNITVNAAPNVVVTSTPTNATICAGDNITLCATGANSYVWTGGITNCTAFTPSASTSYTVTATGTNGCTSTSIKAITVQNNITPSVTISSSPAIPSVGFSATYTANVLPSSILNYQLSWYKANTLIAVNNSPNNTFTTNIGNILDSVYVVARPYNYCVNPDSVASNKIGPRNSDGIVDINELGVKVYPNPTTDYFLIENLQMNDAVELVNGVGQILQKKFVNTKMWTIDVSQLAKGIYFIRIHRGNKTSILKIGKI